MDDDDDVDAQLADKVIESNTENAPLAVEKPIAKLEISEVHHEEPIYADAAASKPIESLAAEKSLSPTSEKVKEKLDKQKSLVENIKKISEGEIALPESKVNGSGGNTPAQPESPRRGKIPDSPSNVAGKSMFPPKAPTAPKNTTLTKEQLPPPAPAPATQSGTTPKPSSLKKIPTTDDGSGSATLSKGTPKPVGKVTIVSTPSSSGLATPKSDSKFGYCKKHKDKPNEVVCLQDKIVMCLTCAFYDGHRDHDVRPLNEVQKEISDRAEKICDSLTKIEEREKNISEWELVKNMQDLMGKNKKDLVERVGKLFKQVQQDIDKKRQDILAEVDTVFDTLQKKITKDLDLPKDTKVSLNAWKNE
jgi:hypothetical protein